MMINKSDLVIFTKDIFPSEGFKEGNIGICVDIDKNQPPHWYDIKSLIKDKTERFNADAISFFRKVNNDDNTFITLNYILQLIKDDTKKWDLYNEIISFKNQSIRVSIYDIHKDEFDNWCYSIVLWEDDLVILKYDIIVSKPIPPSSINDELYFCIKQLFQKYRNINLGKIIPILREIVEKEDYES